MAWIINMKTDSGIHVFWGIKWDDILRTACRLDLDSIENAGKEVNRQASYAKKAANLEEGRSKG